MIYIKKNSNNSNQNFARSKLWDWITSWGGKDSPIQKVRDFGQEIQDNNNLLNGGIPKSEHGLSKGAAANLVENKEWNERVADGFEEVANNFKKRANELNAIPNRTLDQNEELAKVTTDIDNFFNTARGIRQGKIEEIRFNLLSPDLKDIFNKIAEAQANSSYKGALNSPINNVIGTGLNPGNHVSLGKPWWGRASEATKYAFNSARATGAGQLLAAPVGAAARNPWWTTSAAGSAWGAKELFFDDNDIPPVESNTDQKIDIPFSPSSEDLHD